MKVRLLLPVILLAIFALVRLGSMLRAVNDLLADPELDSARWD